MSLCKRALNGISTSWPYSLASNRDRKFCSNDFYLQLIIVDLYFIANRFTIPLLSLKVLDVGCGIGGPLREIARFR